MASAAAKGLAQASTPANASLAMDALTAIPP
ncbi:hypothetical protein MARHY1486 [Marinobacter nauticus ATCC 49840]|nr:hypothetical protein MARHY1486 [Marinobacter nauticus ATCC 49840]